MERSNPPFFCDPLPRWLEEEEAEEGGRVDCLELARLLLLLWVPPGLGLPEDATDLGEAPVEREREKTY